MNGFMFTLKKIEKAAPAEAKRLEDDAKVFIAMGYTVEDLRFVIHDDCPCEVVPKSMLGE